MGRERFLRVGTGKCKPEPRRGSALAAESRCPQRVPGLWPWNARQGEARPEAAAAAEPAQEAPALLGEALLVSQTAVPLAFLPGAAGVWEFQTTFRSYKEEEMYIVIIFLQLLCFYSVCIVVCI